MGSREVSVILTVLNEEENIYSVVKHLMNQTRRPDEIVICDGGSRDNTVTELNRLTEQGVPLKILIAEGACRGRGRNRAIQEAAYPIVALTDAGTVAEPQWLERLLHTLEDNPRVDIVYGTVTPEWKDRLSRCIAALTI